MPTIDVQVHCYERNHPGRPWHAVLTGPPEVTGEDMIKAMNSVGVDGALLISVHTMYRWDASYAVGVRNAHPDKFALIKPVDPNDPKVADTLTSRVHGCWINPAAQPQQAAAATPTATPPTTAGSASAAPAPAVAPGAGPPTAPAK